MYLRSFIHFINAMIASEVSAMSLVRCARCTYVWSQQQGGV